MDKIAERSEVYLVKGGVENHKLNEPYVYTVTEITRRVRALLEEDFSDICILGEISNLKIPSSGHIYFSLKDQASSLRAVLFRGKAGGINFVPEDGMMLRAHGYLSVYEPRGEYQLIINYIEPAGLGNLHIAFEKLKERLGREGLFDEAHKKPLPLFPETIGVVTSPTGSAIRDILNVLSRRFGNTGIILNPVRVQGAGAAEEIARAIYEMNKYPARINVLLVGRGGGSIEDLWAFNEEVVARAIFDSRIPIISCVGHETDFTIADFTADMRAPTPSAAAEIVVQNKEELFSKINSFDIRLNNRIEAIFSYLTSRIERYRSSPVLTRPYSRIDELAQRLDEVAGRMSLVLSRRIEEAKGRFGLLEGKLFTLNPLAILERGYSITFKHPQGKIVRDTSQVKVEEAIKVKVHRGEMIARVERINL